MKQDHQNDFRDALGFFKQEPSDPNEVLKTLKKIKWPGLAGIALLAIYSAVSSSIYNDQFKQLKEHHVVLNDVNMVECRIDWYSEKFSSGNEKYFSYQYSYSVNGEMYYGAVETRSLALNEEDIFSKRIRFPLVYQTGNPRNHSLLITPRDFSYFGLPYPDSLQWLLPYVRDN
jgi:hypothetical protein